LYNISVKIYEAAAGTKTPKCWWLLYNNIKQTNCFLISSSH
jgi:hypothetical protein